MEDGGGKPTKDAGVVAVLVVAALAEISIGTAVLDDGDGVGALRQPWSMIWAKAKSSSRQLLGPCEDSSLVRAEREQHC